jgi:hypothetical protein
MIASAKTRFTSSTALPNQLLDRLCQFKFNERAIFVVPGDISVQPRLKTTNCQANSRVERRMRHSRKMLDYSRSIRGSIVFLTDRQLGS